MRRETKTFIECVRIIQNEFRSSLVYPEEYLVNRLGLSKYNIKILCDRYCLIMYENKLLKKRAYQITKTGMYGGKL